jgi:cysteine desulfurase
MHGPCVLLVLPASVSTIDFQVLVESNKSTLFCIRFSLQKRKIGERSHQKRVRIDFSQCFQKIIVSSVRRQLTRFFQIKFIRSSVDTTHHLLTSLETMSSSSQRSSNEQWWMGGCAAVAVGGMYSLYYFQRQQQQQQQSSSSSKSSSNCIYLDYNGTTPVYPDVLERMMPYLQQHYGNPSSSHLFGKEPRRAIDQARGEILQLLGSTPTSPTRMEDLSSIWFTGCGTESDNLAIQLAVQSCSVSHKNKKHVVTCNVEHPAVALYLKHLEAEGVIEVTYVPVQPDGRVVAADMIAALTPHTILVTLMLANNESGALQPVKEVAQACRQRGILMHTDAAQAAGKVSIAVLSDLGDADLVSVVGHKLGAPKGIACLYVRPGCLQEQGRKLSHDHGILLIGGGQEFGRRGGTENTPYVVGFGVAALKAHRHLATNARHMEAMRCRLLQGLQDRLGASHVRANGPSDPNLRLPNTLSVGLENIHSGDLLGEIGHLVAASAGATCHSAAGISSVLRAMQVPVAFARGTLRLSLGPKTTADEIDRAAEIIANGVERQREANKTSKSQ